jgi:hypothetical protein
VRRRTFLAAVATTLGGCSSFGGEGTPSRTLTPAPVPTETASPTPAPFERERDLASAAVTESAVGGRTVSLFPPRYGDPTVEVLVRARAPATADGPARFRAFLRHREGGSAGVPFEHPPFAPRTRFDRAGGGSPAAPDRLFLVPAPDSPVAERVPEVELAHGGDGAAVWRLAEPPTDWLPGSGRLPPGGTLSAPFHLVAGPPATAPPLDRYRAAVSEDGLATLVAWETTAPGPDAGSRFARSLLPPPLPTDRPAVWFHRATRGTRVFLMPSAERAAAPARLTVQLVNHSRQAAGANDWSVYRLRNGSWHELGPLYGDRVARFLPPGGRHRWRFELAHDGPAGGGASGSGVARLGHLGGGNYAIVAGETGEELRPAALVRLDAPPLTVRPTGDARATRDGDTVRVRSDPPTDDRPPERAVLLVERLPLGGGTATPRPSVTPTDAADRGLRRLIAEQVMRSRGLRNSLAFVESGVEIVRLRTSEDVVGDALRRVEARAGRRRFRFGGGRFRVTVDRVRETATVDPGATPSESRQ